MRGLTSKRRIRDIIAGKVATVKTALRKIGLVWRGDLDELIQKIRNHKRRRRSEDIEFIMRNMGGTSCPGWYWDELMSLSDKELAEEKRSIEEALEDYRLYE